MISMRNLVKDLYVMQWRHVANFNDDFLAEFVTVLLFELSAVFSVTTFMLGYHNEDLDYHLCTGRNPTLNINDTAMLMSLPSGVNKETVRIWFQPDVISDPIDMLTIGTFVLILLFNFNSWSYKTGIGPFKTLTKTLKHLGRMFKLSQEESSSVQRIEATSKFANLKLTMLSDKSSLLFNLVFIAALIILAVGKNFGVRNYDSVNQVVHFDLIMGSGCSTAVEHTPCEQTLERLWVRISPGGGIFTSSTFLSHLIINW